MPYAFVAAREQLIARLSAVVQGEERVAHSLNEVSMRRSPIRPGPLAFSLCVLISSLSVLAYASPPDPSWVRGVYDDADFDDVVCLILANAGLVDDYAPVEGRPDFVLTRAEVPPDDLLVAPFSLSSPQPRAPPTI